MFELTLSIRYMVGQFVQTSYCFFALVVWRALPCRLNCRQRRRIG